MSSDFLNLLAALQNGMGGGNDNSNGNGGGNDFSVVPPGSYPSNNPLASPAPQQPAGIQQLLQQKMFGQISPIADSGAQSGLPQFDTSQAQQSPQQSNGLQAPTPPGQMGPRANGIKGYLSNIFYNMGESMKHSVGMPTDQELAQQNFNNKLAAFRAQGDAALQQAHQAYFGELANQYKIAPPMSAEESRILGYPQGTILTQGEKAAAWKQALINRGKNDVQVQKDQGAMARAQLAQGMPMMITPQMAQVAGQPELANQFLSGKSLANFMKVFQATGASIKDLGDQGMWAIDKMGNRIAQVTIGSPTLEKAQAYARARAENTPVDVFDSDGNLTSISQAQQLQTGAPKASTVFQQQGPTATTRTSGQAATGVLSHIPDIKAEVDQLAQRGDLGAVMGRLNTFLNSGYGGNDPLIAKFVADMSLVKSGTLRAHFGARGGQQMYDQWNKVLNTSQDPNAIKGALDSFSGWLQKYGDLGSNFKPKLGNAPAARPNNPASNQANTIPDSAAAQLREGQETTFANGQVWTKRNGTAVQVR